MKLKLAFLLSAIVIINKTYSQPPALEIANMQFQSRQVVPPGPEAAELGKYGNTPVSLFTGTPNVSIPLIQLKGNSLFLPVSLSYHASGFKPEEEATWVGSSWALNAGGVITRSVLNNPDTDDNYFGKDSLLTPPGNLDVIPYYNYMRSVQDGTRETRPDVYYYNFAGHSGKFVVRPDQTVAKAEKDLMIITPCITGSCYESKFTITDEQGITYVFSKVETTTMIPNDEVGQPSSKTYHFVSSWYLTYMSSADGNEVIEFEYDTTANPHVLYQDMLPNKSVSYTYGGKKYEETCTPVIVSQSGNAMNTPPTVSIKRKFLKKIKLEKAGTVVAYIDFISALSRLDSDFDEDRRLNEVKLYSVVNDSSKLVRRYNFGYGYFGNIEATGSQAFLEKRLRLDTLREIATGIDTASPPPYLFTYNEDWSPRFTASLDHWGFYNASSNSSLVPYVYFPGATESGYYFNPLNVGDGANREASLGGSSATMLTKIKYPAGGYTTFEYELNQAKFNDSTIHDVGGIRVKQIIDYSFENKKATVKNYSYLRDDGTTSGRAGIFPIYVTNSTYHHYHGSLANQCTNLTHTECCALNADYGEYDVHTMTVSTNSIFGLGSFQGSPIGYSQVTESQVDLATGMALGKTVYNYESGEYPEYEESIQNGNLIKQSTYDNAGKLLAETNSTYGYTVEGDIQAQIVKAAEVQDNKPYYCKIGTNNFYNYGDWQFPDSSCSGTTGNFPTKLYITNYAVFIQNKHLLTQTQKTYDQLTGRYLYTSKKYSYNDQHNYPIVIEDTTSNGEKIVTTVKYAIDYDTSGTSGNMANNIKDLVNANIPGTPIEKLQYRQYSDNSKVYLNGQITDYELNNPVRVYFLESNPPLTSVTPSAITSGSFTYDSHYRLAGTFGYGTYGNLDLQSKTKDVIKSYMWDYNYQYPVAELITPYMGEVTIQRHSETITVPVNPQKSYTSFETGYKGNLTFSGTPQVETTSPTGKRCYNLGNGSISTYIDSGSAYIVSYWRNSNTNFTVSGSSNVKQGATHNGWTYFEHTVTGVTTTTISGSGLIDEVRVYPKNSIMTTSAYEPLIGATSQCDANNRITYYEYDGLNRLRNVRDDDHNIVKNFKYNYGPGDTLTASATTLYYNADTTAFFVVTGCSGGRVPDTVAYRIPFGKHASFVSQADANSKARADIIFNGQGNANENGACYFRNTMRPTHSHDNVFKNDCLYRKGPGNSIRYEVPAGRYKSSVSQADADTLAVADIAANAQAYANANAGCSCDAYNKRYIDSNCITSTTKMYIGSVLNESTGIWTCYYKWSFNGVIYDDAEIYEETSSGACENE